AAFKAKVSSVTAGSGVKVTGTSTDPVISVLFGTTAETAVAGNDPRLSDERMPLPGSDFYIRNQTAAVQDPGFTISGNRTLGGDLVAGGNATIGLNEYVTGSLATGQQIRVGDTFDAPMVQAAGAGKVLSFSGAPDVSGGGYDNENSDLLQMFRYNVAQDVT